MSNKFLGNFETPVIHHSIDSLMCLKTGNLTIHQLAGQGELLGVQQVFSGELCSQLSDVIRHFCKFIENDVAESSSNYCNLPTPIPGVSHILVAYFYRNSWVTFCMVMMMIIFIFLSY